MSLVSGCAPNTRDSNQFLVRAMDDGLAEIRLCKLALTQSQDDEVKSFARRNIKDHADIDQEITSLAEEKKVKIPQDVSRKQKLIYNKLSRLSGLDFDREFIRHSVNDHETDVQDFRRHAEIGTDPEVRNFAAKALKMLQIHLQISRDLAEKVRERR